ncbi:hypothetical protein GCM10029964_091030 [Kibdelosporangium lantanae]
MALIPPVLVWRLVDNPELPLFLPLWGFVIFVTAFGIRHHAGYAYRIAVRRLARTRGLPRDLMSFLDDAHRLGLLRTEGAAYQFRHAALRDHLAATYRPASPGGRAPDSSSPATSRANRRSSPW